MTPLMIGLSGIVALFFLIALQIPVAFAMIIVGLVGFGLQVGFGTALTTLANEPSGLLSSLDLAVVPLFIMMGAFVSVAGFSRDIYAVAAAFLGHRRGGLGYATISGCALFGSVCGSSTATAATFMRIAFPEMRRHGYADSFSTGCVAAGGALKSLIPPSLIMILYCIITKEFIFDLFLAALVPAVITVIFNLLAVGIVVRVYPELAPVCGRADWSERKRALKQASPGLILILAVFGGLYSGVFTINEAAAVAAVTAFIFALVRGRLTWRQFKESLQGTACITAMLYLMVIGATIFSYSLAYARLPETAVGVAQNLNVPPAAVVIMLLVAYLVIGAVFDEIAAMLITLPIVLPLVVSLGYDPLWWGVINVIVIELGMIIPPIGLIVFILHGMAPQVSLSTIYRGVFPFIVANVCVLGLLVAFPELALLFSAR